MEKPKRKKVSAGLLMYRIKSGLLEVFLVHPGGPFFAKKDEGVWSIPKGEIEAEEDFLKAAIREFEEETGLKPSGEFLPLGTIKQKGGKTVYAWAFKGDRNENQPIQSNTFRIEWPPHSGKQKEFPEIDRAEFFEVETAKRKINPAQIILIERLQSLLEPT
jgi:predicted NUDIX family NTP pyrophosphohydrolase